MNPRSERSQTTRDERGARIVEAARAIAEAEGWPAVTVRRLADAIGYSQPVLYDHFHDGREGIVAAVVVDGYRRLADAIGTPRDRDQAGRIRTFFTRYLGFARSNPAVYQAMSAMTTSITFAAADTPAPLRDAFARIVKLVGAPSGGDERAGAAEAAEIRAELLWSAAHGMTQLTLGKRLRPQLEKQRIDLLAALFAHDEPDRDDDVHVPPTGRA